MESLPGLSPSNCAFVLFSERLRLPPTIRVAETDDPGVAEVAAGLLDELCLNSLSSRADTCDVAKQVLELDENDADLWRSS